MSRVLVWCDDDALRGELLAKAGELGTAVLADGSGLPDQDPMTVAKALADAAADADLVMIGATKRGKDVAPRVAAHLDLPYAAECQSLEAGWKAQRMVLSGNSMATYELGAKAVVTATPGTFEGEGTAAETVSLSGEGSPVAVTGTKGEGDSDFDLASADFVVGVGRGFKKQEDIKLAEDLAAKLPGGAVGCSRPIAADLKWLGEEHWIGLSGHEIKPKVYFAVGVSGQIQHVAGIRGSKLIVAVNTNKDAPIMQVADYAIVGDLYKVLPELTSAL